MVKQAWGRLSVWKRAAVCLLLGASVLHFAVGSWGVAKYGFVDLSIFLQRTSEFAQGGDLYPSADDIEAYRPAAPVYKFPPLFAMLLLPQVQNGVGDHLYLAHWVVHLLLYLAAVTLIGLTLGRRAGPAYLLVLFVVALNFVPFFETLWRLQLETPILFLCALALWLEHKRLPVWAGAALGVAAMFKVYPVFLLGWFVVRRSGRGLAGAALAMLGIGALGWWVIGPEQNLLYWTVILPRLMQEVAFVDPENVSLAKPLQLLGGLAPEIAKRVTQVLSLLALSAGYWVLYRRGDDRSLPIDRELSFGLFLCTMLLFLPNAWTNYLVLLLLPIAIILSRSFAPRGSLPPWAVGTLAFTFFLTLFYTPCGPLDLQVPCTHDPLFLGLFHWPRGLHDLMVEWKTVVTAGVLAVWFAAARRGQTMHHHILP
jgi:hypothetical protein